MQKHIQSLQNYVQVDFPSVVPMLFKSTGITLQHFYPIFSAAIICLPWQSLERQRKTMVWRSAHREIYLHIVKYIYFSYFSFNFSCFENTYSLPVISWFWKFHVPIWVLPILGAYPFSGKKIALDTILYMPHMLKPAEVLKR